MQNGRIRLRAGLIYGLVTMMEAKKITIAQLEALFAKAGEKLPELLSEYEADERPGVKRLTARYRRMQEKLAAELARLDKMLEYERKYQEYTYIAGMDEVGRGPLAGPVVTCAIILPKECKILYVNDSKQLTGKKREELYDKILEQAVAFGIGEVSPERIDEINILNATYEAMRSSVANLKVKPEILLNDAVTVPEITIPQVPIIKGDAKSISIAAASIVAKVTRDRMMEEYDKMYPGYGFASNKGYGSAEHIQALKRLGPSPIHRRSFIHNFVTVQS